MALCACLPPPGSLSLPSMSRELYLTSIIVPSHHIQVSGCASQLNPGPFSTPSRSRRFVSHLHPGSEIHVSSSSQLSLTSIQVLIFVYHLHLDCIFHVCIISNPYMFHNVCLTSSQPCLNCTQVPIIWLNYFVCTVSPPSGSINSRLTSIQVVAHVYAGADIRVSPQFS